MSQSTATQRDPINGVDVATLFATIGAVDDNRELAKFRFRATNKWEEGTYNRSTIRSFYGAGQEHEHVRDFVIEADHPQVLVGDDRAPTPVELVLAGLVSCLTSGIGNIASARGIALHSVESTIEGEMDLLGILGLDSGVRNGYERLRIDFKISGDAPAEKLEQIVMQSKARSAVYDIVTNGVPVEISVQAG